METGMAEFSIHVNQQTFTVNAQADIPLLWVLRDFLGHTGTKYSCGIGLCGSCTVLIDGEPTRSCITPIEAVGEAQITTIEGLSVEGDHPVQQAWLDAHVSQCGYCQPGQILTAVALLEKTPKPTDDDIDRALQNVLCRCGTYQRIRQAIHLAAKAQQHPKVA
jgi:aerobic-type carbon monoxide dehydrogenase small subunit (CoxS/CutS family)